MKPSTTKLDLEKPYKPGDVVFRSKPYAWCLANRYIDKYCHYCCAPLPYATLRNRDGDAVIPVNAHKPLSASLSNSTLVVDALKCIRCQLAVYCSTECKKLAWCLGGHRKECVLFQAWTKAYQRSAADDGKSAAAQQQYEFRHGRGGPSSSLDEKENQRPSHTTTVTSETKFTKPSPPHLHWLPHEITRIISRIIIKLAQGIERNTDDALGECECRPETGVVFNDLMSHWSDEREHDMESNSALTQIYQQLDDGFPADWHKERDLLKWDRLGEIFGRVMTNAFCIEEYVNLKLIGLSVFLCPAKVDHSCRPNVSYAMKNGIEVEMIAVEPIPRFELARTSYLVDLSDPRDLRRYDLRKQWYFYCGCDGCVDDARERRIAAIQCPFYDCGAAMYADEALISAVSSVVRSQKPQSPETLNNNSKTMTCKTCGKGDISTYYVREALSVMDEMVAFMNSPKEMLFVGERLLNRITSFVHISNGLMPTYLIAYLDALHQNDQDDKTVCCINNKRRLTATLLLLTVESLSQTADLWPKNFMCHGITLLRAFRHLHRFVSAQLACADTDHEEEDGEKGDAVVQDVFSTIADQNNKLLVNTGGIPRRAPGQQLAQKAEELLTMMQECFELHFGARPAVNVGDSSVNDDAGAKQHPVLKEISDKHAPLVNRLQKIFSV